MDLQIMHSMFSLFLEIPGNLDGFGKRFGNLEWYWEMGRYINPLAVRSKNSWTILGNSHWVLEFKATNDFHWLAYKSTCLRYGRRFLGPETKKWGNRKSTCRFWKMSSITILVLDKLGPILRIFTSHITKILRASRAFSVINLLIIKSISNIFTLFIGLYN